VLRQRKALSQIHALSKEKQNNSNIHTAATTALFKEDVVPAYQVKVFDFDGTLTDITREAIPVRQEFIGRVAPIIGLDSDQLEQRVCAYEERLKQDPGTFGWTVNGHLVALSNADPYILPLEAVRFMMQEMGGYGSSHDEIQTRLHGIFDECFAAVGDHVVFREGIEQFLFAMRDQPAYIVTGSKTQIVQAKIATLGNGFGWLFPRIRGDAQKYTLSEQIPGVPETFVISGYDRPLYIRRPIYYQYLAAILEGCHCKWDEMLVVGDNFETDGALPYALGAGFSLMSRKSSLQHEVDFLRTQAPRGTVISTLEEAYELLIR